MERGVYLAVTEVCRRKSSGWNLIFLCFYKKRLFRSPQNIPLRAVDRSACRRRFAAGKRKSLAARELVGREAPMWRTFARRRRSIAALPAIAPVRHIRVDAPMTNLTRRSRNQKEARSLSNFCARRCGLRLGSFHPPLIPSASSVLGLLSSRASWEKVCRASPNRRMNQRCGDAPHSTMLRTEQRRKPVRCFCERDPNGNG